MHISVCSALKRASFYWTTIIGAGRDKMHRGKLRVLAYSSLQCVAWFCRDSFYSQIAWREWRVNSNFKKVSPEGKGYLYCERYMSSTLSSDSEDGLRIVDKVEDNSTSNQMFKSDDNRSLEIRMFEDLATQQQTMETIRYIAAIVQLLTGIIGVIGKILENLTKKYAVHTLTALFLRINPTSINDS